MNFYLSNALIRCYQEYRNRKAVFHSKISLIGKLSVMIVSATILQVNANGQVNNITLSENNVPLNKVLDEIRKQSGYKLLYNADMLDKAHPVTIHMENSSLREVLDRSISDQPFEYQLKNNTILITPRVNAFMDVRGKVLDERGMALPGASVKAKGTSLGTMTDANGNFALKGVETGATLVISFVGYQHKEVKAAANLTVTLEPDKSDLNEVTVIGYGVQKKSEVTGSISSVKGSALAEQPVASFESALNGRATGVNMTANDGVLNQAPTFRIRGTNSLSLSSYPLIVVDGVPMFTEDVSVGGNAASNPLSAINTNDIESIDIAKDAAATSIYGSRAANGVVFITTKSGKKGKAKFSYNAYYGNSKATRLAEVLNGEQYLEIKNEGLKNAGTYDPVKNYYGTSLDANGNIIDTRWYDYIFRTGNSQNHNISLSGANDATKYYFSVGYTDRQGILKGNDYERKSVSYNVEHKVNNWFKVGSKTNYSSDETSAILSTGTGVSSVSSNSVAYRLGFITAPIVGPYNADGTFNVIGQNVGIMDNAGHLTSTARLGYTNPVLSLQTNSDNTSNNYIQSNIYGEITPLSWITFRTAYGVNNMYSRTNRYFDPRTNEGMSANGSATGVSAKKETNVWTNTLTANRKFKEHSFDLLLGEEEQTTKGDRFGLTRSNQSDPFYTDIQGGFGNVAISNTANQKSYNYLISLFSRVQYNYARKYFLTANFRRDEASVLGLENKAGNFWGFSGAWELNQEGFWANSAMSKVFDSFKFKASYGKVGNLSGIGDYASLSTYGANLYGGLPGLYYSAAGNPDLRWETSKKTDLGINFSMFNYRLTADLSYYKNNIDGLIFGVPVPASAGLPGANQNTVLANVGSMYNTGIELSLNGVLIKKDDIGWNTNFNISYNKNQVKALAPGVSSLIINDVGGSSGMVSISLPGSPVGMIYAIRTDGVDPETGRRIFLDGSGRKVYYEQVPAAGHYQWEYEDGSIAKAVTTTDDGVIYKNTNPKFYGGLSNTFRYKNFDLDVMLTYQFGGNMYYATQASLMDYRFQNNDVKVLDRWQKKGDITDVPKVQDGDITSWGYSLPITANVYRSDFVRLKNVTLGYALPKSVMQKVKIESARFYVSGQNLAIITPYPGADPEVTSTGNATATQGFDKNMTPNARTFTLGVQVGF
ncbi:TonB-dependent receptor [Pedobacter antarcticus]|uniref:TonB-dependent receptor n=1 Tax=Pedobacter antarcticus TaxID=34086 RepID=UPI00292F5ACF|nr:TonB-dependent receptor [Pedobacter antarcticus]